MDSFLFYQREALKKKKKWTSHSCLSNWINMIKAYFVIGVGMRGEVKKKAEENSCFNYKETL